MSADELAALVAKTKAAASEGTYELFKTSSIFDGTALHPEWLGDESAAVKKLAPG